jgi:DNA-directed RNA polymerase specialized sigma24 family protein
MCKNLPFSSEKELVTLLKLNNKTAFEYIYDHYGSGLYGIVCKIEKDEAKALNIMQDTFIKIWQNIQHYDQDNGTLFTWMLLIARNTAINRTRIDSKFEGHAPWGLLRESDVELITGYGTEH